MKELRENLKNASELWPNELGYKGINICDWYCTVNAYNALDEMVGIGETWEEDIYLDEDAYVDTMEDVDDLPDFETVNCELDGQECYMGYIPSKDIFVTGYDMWESKSGDYIDEYNSCTGLCFYKLKPKMAEGDKATDVVEIEKVEMEDLGIDTSNGLFYATVYNKLHEKFEDLADLRLD